MTITALDVQWLPNGWGPDSNILATFPKRITQHKINDVIDIARAYSIRAVLRHEGAIVAGVDAQGNIIR